MSGNRAVDMKSKRGVLDLINHLEKQGARVEWSGNGKSNGGGGTGPVGSFPARVFPPDRSKGFILIHGSASDGNATTLKRNDVRRAGLLWPGDEEPSRKETEVPQSAQKPGQMQHQRIPGAVLNRKYPPLESRVQAMLPILAGMPETFWTDAFVSAARAAGASGFASTSGMSNAQEMLDWLGWRVVESKRNRNGYSYRWVKDPNAVVGVGSDTSTRAARGNAARGRDTNVTDIRPKETPSLGELVDESMAALQQRQEQAPTVLSATPGPIAAAFAEAERKKAEHKKHERKQCPTCLSTFTPEGYQHHVEETQHGVPVLTTTATVTIADLTPAEQAHVAETAETAETGVQQGDYEAMEQMATEAEARAVAAETRASDLIARLDDAETQAGQLNTQLNDANEAFARRGEQLGEERRAHKEAFDRAVELQQQLERAEAARDEATRLLDEAMRLHETRTVVDDGSWLIDVEQVRGVPIDTIVQNASVLGVTVELRGRRS